MKVTKNGQMIWTYTLELTQDEAEFLHTVLGSVGGHPVKSRRKIADDISQVLSSAGIRHNPDQTEITGTLWVKDEVVKGERICSE